MTITAVRAQQLMNAMSEGQLWVDHLEPGMLFRGTHGQGRYLYPNDAQLADFFGSAAYSALKKYDIWVDDANVITRVETKSHKCRRIEEA